MNEKHIPLSDLLARLREELLEAQEEGKDSALKLEVQEIEAELHVTATQEGSGRAGIKLWVLNAEAGGNDTAVTTQRLKLKLKPKGADGTNFDVSANRPKPM